MSDARREPRLPPIETPLLEADGKTMSRAWWRYFQGERGYTDNVNSGVAILAAEQTAQATRIAQEQAARIANDGAVQAAAGGGAATTSNAAAFSNGVSSGATWSVIATVTLTPSGAGGDYTITAELDTFIGGNLNGGTVFYGNWRIIEELTSGGTEYTLDSGTFTVDYTAGETFSEAGIIFSLPDSWTTSFVGLPAGLIAANNSAQSDIRLEIQRASGTNEITAPGLSGSMSVVWTA